MKHLALTQFGTPSESVALHDDRDPAPGPGDVLVRMEAAAVNPSDLLLVRGKYLARPEPPAPVGGEGVGIVVAAGAQADQGLLGKRVIVLPTYTYGTWAEKVVVPHDKVVEVAPDADPLQLAMLAINPATAHVMLNRFVDLKPGDWVAQPGANSSVGRLVIILAPPARTQDAQCCAARRGRRRGARRRWRACAGQRAGSGCRHRPPTRRRTGQPGARRPRGRHRDGAGRRAAFRRQHRDLRVAGGGPSQVPNADLLGRELRHTGFWLLTWLSHAGRQGAVRLRSTAVARD